MTEAQVRKSGLKDGHFVLEGHKEQITGEAERGEGRQKAHPSPLRTRLPVPAEFLEL